MRYLLVYAFLGVGLLSGAVWDSVAALHAEEAAPPGGEAQPPASPGTEPVAAPIFSPPDQIKGVPRVLAPGVLITIPPDIQVDETHTRQDIVELVARDPSYDWAKDRDSRRTIHCLEFQFKIPRLIEVDVPQVSGRLQRKPILYLVYAVKNTGKELKPVLAEDGTYRVDDVAEPVRFVPRFILQIHDLDKSYPDRPNPLIVSQIRRVEDPAIHFFDTTDMNGREIAVGETLWGVATWEEIDPSLNRFSILVGGLSNAYRWQDPPGAYKPGDPIGQGRLFSQKFLKLNFWRPGDEYIFKASQIRFGIPGQVDYEWTFR